MKYEIKEFNNLNIEELYQILKVRCEVFIVEQECPYQDIDEKDKKSYHLMVKNNNEIIGYLRIIEKNVSYDEISIGRVLVKKEYRKNKVAQNMMKEAILFIEKELGEETIRISAQKYLINFYKNLGFKETSEEYLEDDIPHIEMMYSK